MNDIQGAEKMETERLDEALTDKEKAVLRKLGLNEEDVKEWNTLGS